MDSAKLRKQVRAAILSKSEMGSYMGMGMAEGDYAFTGEGIHQGHIMEAIKALLPICAKIIALGAAEVKEDSSSAPKAEGKGIAAEKAEEKPAKVKKEKRPMTKKQQDRIAAVKKVMKKQKLSMPEASKYVKEHNVKY